VGAAIDNTRKMFTSACRTDSLFSTGPCRKRKSNNRRLLPSSKVENKSSLSNQYLTARNFSPPQSSTSYSWSESHSYASKEPSQKRRTSAMHHEPPPHGKNSLFEPQNKRLSDASPFYIL
jgi:hypothetical protein